MHNSLNDARIIIKISGGRHVSLKFFGNPPEKTRKLEFYIRPVETRTTNISGGNNPRFVILVAHVTVIVFGVRY